MSYELSIQEFQEYKRLYLEAELTEEGLFVSGKTPDDLITSFTATVELVFAVIMVDSVGRISFQKYNPPPVLDKDRNEIDTFEVDGREVRSGSGTKATLLWKENHYLQKELKNIGSIMWKTFEKENSEWVL